MKISIPESDDPVIKAAADAFDDVALVPAKDLNEAAHLVNAGVVDIIL